MDPKLDGRVSNDGRMKMDSLIILVSAGLNLGAFSKRVMRLPVIRCGARLKNPGPVLCLAVQQTYGTLIGEQRRV
jgi:hypothetical protein